MALQYRKSTVFVLPNPEMQNFHVLCDHTVDFEAGFIRLLDKLTNGSKIEVNETGAYEEDNIHLLVLITQISLFYAGSDML